MLNAEKRPDGKTEKGDVRKLVAEIKKKIPGIKLKVSTAQNYLIKLFVGYLMHCSDRIASLICSIDPQTRRRKRNVGRISHNQINNSQMAHHRYCL